MLELKNINMSFALKGKFFQTEKRAVVIRDFDLTIGDDEIIAVVGESGCGKTTIGKIVTGLLAPTSGEVLFNGENIRRTKRNNKSDYRRNVQFIQQDSYAALNPVKTIHQSLCAAIEIAEKGISKEKKQQRENTLLLFSAKEKTFGVPKVFSPPPLPGECVHSRIGLITTDSSR